MRVRMRVRIRTVCWTFHVVAKRAACCPFFLSTLWLYMILTATNCQPSTTSLSQFHYVRTQIPKKFSLNPPVLTCEHMKVWLENDRTDRWLNSLDLRSKSHLTRWCIRYVVHLEWNVSNMILLVNHKGLKVVLITIVELMLMMYNHKHKHKNQDGQGIDDKN